MKVIPISLKDANDFISKYHRHHRRTQGHKFSIGLISANKLVGVVVVGRPVNRTLDNGLNAEVTRLCTDGTRNACSRLYAAASNAAKAMGYENIYTYILDSESGSSLKASGWSFDKLVRGETWDRKNRERIDKHPTENKTRWIKRLHTQSEFSKNWVSSPSETIRDILKEKGLSELDLAISLDIKESQLSLLLNDQITISKSNANKLSRSLGSTPEFWERRFNKFQQLQHKYTLS